MTTYEIADFYSNLDHGEKGLFTAFVSCRCGGTPHTWQNKFIKWKKDISKVRNVSPPILRELNSIIASGSWHL